MRSIAKWLMAEVCEWFENETEKSHAILIPMRLFIGLGWLRSSVEKLIDPDWYSGVALIRGLGGNYPTGRNNEANYLANNC